MIKQAQIQWRDGTPISTQFEDVYFSTINGINETRYVFLQHNNLVERWQAHIPTVFTIAETGFGTGLNFLCTWQEWLQHSHNQQTLHFVSVERFPLNHQNLQQALQPFPELKKLSDALLSVYPNVVSGWHSINLPSVDSHSGNVVLHLYFGDIKDWLTQMSARVDAWFLDGFAPSKNPDMWGPDLFHAMARLSHRDSTFATFTAAGDVRRGLNIAGFRTKKAKGFAKKREMLYGQFNANQGPIAPVWLSEKPWFSREYPANNHYSNSIKNNIKNNSQTQHAVVIGAGISGCACAYSLAIRGFNVTIIDEGSSTAAGASGNAQGVLYAKLSSDMNIQSTFYLAGYLYSLQLLKKIMPNKKDWDDCGVLQLAFSEKEYQRQQQFCQNTNLSDIVEHVNADQASALAGTPLNNSGLYFKNGAWVHPKAWCDALISHDNITFLPNTKVSNIESHGQLWKINIESGLSDTTNTITTDQLIVCNAQDAKRLAPFSFLPTQPIAGQVSQVASPTMQLKTVLCGDSYVTPTYQGSLNFGATYRLKSTQCNVSDDDHTENLTKLHDNFPSVAQQLSSANQITKQMNGRVSVRCTTPDYVPIVGAVCDHMQFEQDFNALNKSKHWRFYQPATYLKGLYLNIGHGSRGLSSAPLCAELIAAQINGEPWPVMKIHGHMLSPNRFLVSQAIKRKT